MAEPVTGAGDYGHRWKLAVSDDVTPTSHAVTNSDGLRVETMTPESKWITKKFMLPEDWIVEQRPRGSGTTIDKYYHDPETGRKFRSLKDVERYLTKGIIPPSKSSAKRLMYHEQECSKRKKIVSSRKMQDFEENRDDLYQLINVPPTSFISTSHFELPDGWIVEEVPRKTGDRADRYYYEPGTGQKFRSLPSVKKHLAELEENSPLSVVLEELREKSLPLSKAFKLATPKKNYGSYDSWKIRISRKKQDPSCSNATPNKTKWVISSAAGGTWDAYVGDELVPDTMKQQWGKRFVLAISATKYNEQE